MHVFDLCVCFVYFILFLFSLFSAIMSETVLTRYFHLTVVKWGIFR